MASPYFSSPNSDTDADMTKTGSMNHQCVESHKQL